MLPKETTTIGDARSHSGGFQARGVDAMLRILGNPKRACDGLTRRELLVASGLGALGLGLSRTGSWAGSTPAPPAGRPKRAKSVICLFLFGGVSQLDTFDLKPEAPVEIRGEYKPIASTVPGLQVCELLPQLAQRMHRLALIRSVTSPDANHNTGLILTGHNPREGLHPSPSDWPFFMSALQYLRQRAGKEAGAGAMPQNMCVPNRLGLLEGYHRSGPYGNFLGRRYDPVCTRFGQNGQHLYEPGSVTPQMLDFTLPATRLGPEITLDQLQRRYGLLEQLDRQRQVLQNDPIVADYDRSQLQALEMITSPRMRQALDLNRESEALRVAAQ